ncbi:hypothetical protein GCM10011506_02690 [Marivirga lumbricoides]|uniref:Lipocalin-like domain-containing protein n=1 Tax=Marivirga lumbricoides TaxID=1046115 RepID=A0A2T4DUV0_9BACT|nr:hypothetical protein C9994_02160 [Marivirga lumbricoides]GGC20955.1 hypothetical protein GCM10011506_02690 [Marivirga lumbricoides]
MKKNFTLLSYVVIALTLVFTACKKDDDVSPEEEKINQLNGTWEINSAKTPDANETLSGVSITFSGANTTYTVNGLATLESNNLNHGDVFAASGSFSLSGSNFNELTLVSGKVITINVTETTLTLNYSSPYPKPTSDNANITLTATKQ